jgi:hypothetical protein
MSTEDLGENVENSTDDQRESVEKNSEPHEETNSQDILTHSSDGEGGKNQTL